jgi:hypothetical protein
MSAIDDERIEAVLRSDLPEPSPAFTAELDRRVAEGFPKPSRRRLSLPTFWPALAAAATVIVVAVVAIGLLGNESGKQASTGGSISSSALSPRSAPNAQFLAAGTGRKVERNVQLTIAAARDKLQQAADGIGTVAENHGGFVLSSHVTTGDTGTSGGSFELRVPQRELQATIADLSKLGDLRSRSENGQDMTASYNSVRSRLGDALVERGALKLRLRHAHGVKADEIRARLATLNAAIDALNSRMKNLRSRTVYSTVSVTLEQAKKGSGGTGAAFDDARRILQGMLNFTVRALAVLLPLALLVALAAFGTRILRRRRREAALQ